MFLSLTIFLFCFQNPSDINVRSFVIASLIPEPWIIFFFQSTFCLMFRLSNFYCSIVQFTVSPLCPCPVMLLSLEFIEFLKILVIVFFSSKISVWFFFMFFTCFLTLSTLLFVSRMFTVAYWHFSRCLL